MAAKKNTAETPLSARQERFVQEYVLDYNATQAAIRAGYSERSARYTASDLLRRPNILARIRALQAELRERLSLTEDRVIAELFAVYERCMTAVPVMEYDAVLKEMVESGEYTFDSRGAIRALELIGKHGGMFSDKLKVEGNVTVGTGQLASLLEARQQRRRAKDDS